MARSSPHYSPSSVRSDVRNRIRKDHLDPPILLAATCVIVARDWRAFAVTRYSGLAAAYAALHQRSLYGFGATQRQALVARIRADVVRMAFDDDAAPWLVFQCHRQPVERSIGARLERRASG